MIATPPLMLYLPDPVGWIALTPEVLHGAQVLAREALATVLGSADDPPPASDTVLLSAEEAAGLLAVDASWLMRQAREGRIPCVKLGKFVRFDPREIIGRCT